MQETKRVKNPRKQRKMLFNAPAHIRHKFMSAPLSPELASSRGTKSLPVRKGDTVRIQRGDNKGFEGKVSRVDLKSYRIYIEGLTREKVDGTNIFLPVHPSKVQIRNLYLDDKWRKDVLGRKKEIEKPEKEEKPKPTTKAEKPAVEIEEGEVAEEKPLKQEAVAEVASEEAPAEAEMKKVTTKKTGAKKKAEISEEKPSEEEAEVKEAEMAPPKKAAKPRAAKKKIAEPEEPPATETTAKKTAAKTRGKRKTSEETEGGQ